MNLPRIVSVIETNDVGLLEKAQNLELQLIILFHVKFMLPWVGHKKSENATNLSSLTAAEWLMVFLAGCGSVLWFEIYKATRKP